jgi:hypothetical protein
MYEYVFREIGNIKRELEVVNTENNVLREKIIVLENQIQNYEKNYKQSMNSVILLLRENRLLKTEIRNLQIENRK